MNEIYKSGKNIELIMLTEIKKGIVVIVLERFDSSGNTNIVHTRKRVLKYG